MQTRKQTDSPQKTSFSESQSRQSKIQKKISKRKAGNKKLGNEENPDNSKTKTENKPYLKGDTEST